jgi:hypothetical protein
MIIRFSSVRWTKPGLRSPHFFQFPLPAEAGHAKLHGDFQQLQKSSFPQGGGEERFVRGVAV